MNDGPDPALRLLDALEALRRTALLGTHHGPLRLEPVDAALDALFAPRDGEAPERTVLRAAAVAGAMRRAGATVPMRDDEPALEAPDDVLPRCGPLAAADLRFIASERRHLVPEWVATAARAGVRIPEEVLPDALAAFAKTRPDRDAMSTVLDARGRWLAAQNPDWSFAVETVDPWRRFAESPHRAERVLALGAMRRIDAARARETLERDWEREDPGDRAALVAALGAELSLADEALLERARNDKRKDVRTAANDLLHRLPASQSAARALALVSSMLAMTRTSGVAQLAVALPDACTPEMQREGIEPKPAAGSGGERAWWLEQAVAATPVAALCAQLDVTFETLLRLARETDFAEPLLRGIAAAVAHYRDTEALQTLFELAASDAAYADLALRGDHDALDASLRSALALAALREQRPVARDLLATIPGPWTGELGEATLADARAGLESSGDWQAFAQRRRHLELLAARLDPRTAGCTDDWPQTYASEHARTTVDAFVAEISLRRALLDHLESTA